MKRCTRCVLPDTKPDLHFEDGVCSACRAYARRPEIDWEARKRDLVALLDRHDGRCIVPSSGGKDSTAQALMLIELGARPTVVTATTCMLTSLGRRNIDNLARYADTIEVTPNQVQRAKLNCMGLEMVGDISWPEHVAIFTTPFNVAVATGTPLIFYGENPQDQYGGPPGSQDARVMTRRWVSEFGGFLGLRPADVESVVGDMAAYKPPSEAELHRVGVEAHFLGQYIPWDSHENARRAIAAGMMYAQPTAANWWPWENLDNAMTGIHDHMMWRKYGYGRGAAQISVDVRAGRVTRDAALQWTRDHDGLFPERYMGIDHREVLQRIGVDESRFRKTLDQFTDWNIFRRVVDDSRARPALMGEER